MMAIRTMPPWTRVVVAKPWGFVGSTGFVGGHLGFVGDPLTSRRVGATTSPWPWQPHGPGSFGPWNGCCSPVRAALGAINIPLNETTLANLTSILQSVATTTSALKPAKVATTRKKKKAAEQAPIVVAPPPAETSWVGPAVGIGVVALLGAVAAMALMPKRKAA